MAAVRVCPCEPKDLTDSSPELRFKIVLVRAGQALTGLQLRARVLLLMFRQLRKEDGLFRERIGDGRNGLIVQRQRFAAAGKFLVIQPRLLRQLSQVSGAVGNEDRADLRPCAD